MARIDTSEFSEFLLDMEELARLPDEVIEKMLLAEAEVAERAIKSKGRSYGVEDTGMTLASITTGKVKRTKLGMGLNIYPKGKNKRGDRNAEVAFINEFGKHGQPARPFMRDACEEAADEVCEAAEKIYNQYLNSKKL